MTKKQKNKLNLTSGNRAILLRMLDELKKGKPKNIYYLNILNTGFVVDSKQVRDILINLIKGVIAKK